MSKIYMATIILLITVPSLLAQIFPHISWLQIYDGTGGSIDLTNHSIIDKDYNFYLAGRSAGVNGPPDLLILKFSRFGDLLTEIRYNSGPASWDEAYSIAVDSSNNIYCTGTGAFGTSSPIALIHKYSPSGNLIWSKNFFNTSKQYSIGKYIAVDSENNILAGYELDDKAYIAKLTPSADSIWAFSVFDDTSNYLINYILPGDNGEIYFLLTQIYPGFHVPNVLIHLYKLNNAGNLLWKKEFEAEAGRKLTSDNNGNIFLLLTDEQNGVIVKLNSAGEILWQNNSGVLILTDLEVDFENNILVTGYDVTSTSFDYFTKKYSADGVEIWQQIFNSEENLKDYPFALAVDGFGNVYVTGSSHNSFTHGVSYTLRYSSNGDKIWQHKFDAPHSIFETAKFIFLDDSSNIFIGGDVSDSTNGLNFFALRIDQSEGLGVELLNSNIPAEYSLLQNYPNPFNPNTNIDFSLQYSGQAHLELFDALGRKSADILNQYLLAGNYSVSFNSGNLSSGIYYYRLIVNDFIQIKKAVLIK